MRCVSAISVGGCAFCLGPTVDTRPVHQGCTARSRSYPHNPGLGRPRRPWPVGAQAGARLVLCAPRARRLDRLHPPGAPRLTGGVVRRSAWGTGLSIHAGNGDIPISFRSDRRGSRTLRLGHDRTTSGQRADTPVWNGEDRASHWNLLEQSADGRPPVAVRWPEFRPRRRPAPCVGLVPRGHVAVTSPAAAGTLNGVRLLPGRLDPEAQFEVLQAVRRVVAAAPLFQPVTARGHPMSVRMTAAGAFGWVSDKRGYRYEAHHPSGAPWPPIPARLHDLWEQVLPGARQPECCLVNFYGEGARMGLHQDRDEADLSQPVLSISLGDDGLFRVGGTVRSAPTRSCWLHSGDTVILEGAGRMAFHGVDRIRFGSSRLLAQGGRLNLTLRVVT